MFFEHSLILLVLMVPEVILKPIDFPPIEMENLVNEIDTGNQRDYKKVTTTVWESKKPEFDEISSPLPILSIEKTRSNDNNNNNDTREDEISAKTRNQEGFAWFLAPFTQKLQFSPQLLFEEKLGQLKNTLSNIGTIFPNQKSDHEGKVKQFANVAVENLLGLNDSGFYTDRLEPAGFFGGNGWLANKGGILGGPGAFISTGSLLTDYQTPYKK